MSAPTSSREEESESELQSLRHYLEEQFAVQKSLLHDILVAGPGEVWDNSAGSPGETLQLPTPGIRVSKQSALSNTSDRSRLGAPGRTTTNTQKSIRFSNNLDILPRSMASGASERSGRSLFPMMTETTTRRPRSVKKRSNSEASQDSTSSQRRSFVRVSTQAHKARAEEESTRLRSIRERTAVVKRTSTLGLVTDRSSSADSNAPSECSLRNFVHSPLFTNFMCLLIASNIVLLGIEVDVAARLGQEDLSPWFGIINLVIVGFFVLEMALKFMALGCRHFWRGDEAAWNIFDFTIVAISVAEAVADFWSQSLSVDQANPLMQITPSVQVIRAFRALRMIRLFRYVSALRTLALSMLGTAASLFWTLSLLILLFYTVGATLTQLVMDHCRSQTVLATGDPNAVPVCLVELSQFWASVPESMLTLFMIISGGLEWFVVMQPLRRASSVALFVLVLYVTITVFAVLNIVTGVFCNTAIETANADKDIATMKQARQRTAQIGQLKDIFAELDYSKSGMIGLADLEEAMAQKKMRYLLDSMGISIDNVWTFFMLLDSDENGLVNVEEFVSGCMQLHGPARSLQLAKMSYENKVTRQAIKNLSEEVSALSYVLLHGDTGGSSRSSQMEDLFEV